MLNQLYSSIRYMSFEFGKQFLASLMRSIFIFQSLNYCKRLDVDFLACDSAHPTGRIEELLQEDQEVKARREKCQRQAAALSKLTKQLSLQEARTAAVASSFGDSCKF